MRARGSQDGCTSRRWARLVQAALEHYFRGQGWDGATSNDRQGAVILAVARYYAPCSHVGTPAAGTDAAVQQV